MAFVSEGIIMANEIAQTILDQIKGSPLVINGRPTPILSNLARWGVKQKLAWGETGLLLVCTKGIHVCIVLDPTDTYTVSIGKAHARAVKEKIDDVYAESLAETINSLFSRNYP
jgi:hypothetical protein